nr:hypothetical protein [Streptococcus thermophilus]
MNVIQMVMGFLMKLKKIKAQVLTMLIQMGMENPIMKKLVTVQIL